MPALLTVALAEVCAAASPRPADHPQAFAAETHNALADKFEAMVNQAKVPASALIVVDSASAAQPTVFVRAFGKARADTPFRLGSITKTFTALALIDAAARTETPLSASAHTVIGTQYWQNPWRAEHPVTLAQLVELSAGFSDISGAEFASAAPMELRQALESHRASHTSRWPPGAFHSYSNLPPAFSALAVEALTGKPFADYLHTHILAPLGMAGASLEPLAGLPGGFKADGLTEIPYWHTIYPAFGGLNATVDEFSNFLLRLVAAAPDPVLDNAREYRGPVPLHQPLTTRAARAGLALGYGAGMYGWEVSGQLFFGHGGDADGYRSRYGVMPERQRGYFMVINTDNPALESRLRTLVEQSLTADLMPGSTTATFSESAQRPRLSATQIAQELRRADRFAGPYVRATLRFGADRLQGCATERANLTIQNGRALWQRGATHQVLVPAGGGRFHKDTDVFASVILVEAEGARQFLGELGNWIHEHDADHCAGKPRDKIRSRMR